MSLSRLIYASRPKLDFTTNSLDEMAYRSAVNNLRCDVSGMLIYDGYEFLQVLEGTAETIGKLFGIIKNDPRHCGVKMICFDDIAQRKFAQWGMSVMHPHQIEACPTWSCRPDKLGHQFHAFSADEAMQLLLPAAQLSKYWKPLSQDTELPLENEPSILEIN